MSRTNIDLDDDAVAEVMQRFDLRSKRDAVNFALNQLRRRPLTAREIDALSGSGWGDGLELDDLRGTYVPLDR
ncbi:MAG TPA: type II toxin-antitoxin system VapB family antitoxin [Jatrophihabitans sp.]|uniref:type II toxin-antitoxin system VapB family antitoxin n=1 Tax=Jatrophihabitans sp. TaxID=1932789 RepID=UPI002DFE7AD4|nr:type II toxin-antitoxin system VapB family antitoxin [Jatrophihabitans sp.]